MRNGSLQHKGSERLATLALCPRHLFPARHVCLRITHCEQQEAQVAVEDGNSDAEQDEIDVVFSGQLAEFAEKVRDGQGFDATLATQSHAMRSVVDRVTKTAAIADATEFIQRLNHGIATSVGAAGNKFSGGQKQRLALARAVRRDPKILLLDEATSALDSRSERLIQGALREASKGRTTINIAHRLSTVRHADNIIVMRSGKMVEQGTHEDLLAADGTYASMVRLQNVRQHNPTKVLGAGDISEDDIPSADGRMSDETVGKEKSVPGEKYVPAESEKIAVEMDDDADKNKPILENGSKRGVWSTICGIGTLTRSQALWLLVAFTSSAIVGGSYSGEAVIFGHTISSSSACKSAASILSAGHFWGLLFFILAIVEFLANFCMGTTFGLVSENTLEKIRVLCLRTLLGQDIDGHESGRRDAADLLSYLTTDGNALAGLTGPVLGTLFSVIINTFAGIILSMIVAWRIAIVLLACVPVLLGSGIMRLREVRREVCQSILERYRIRDRSSQFYSCDLNLLARGRSRQRIPSCLKEPV